eukprot:m.58151 g.58151  ORF g.58151 m.58151 type:complete len:639 (-) comp7127_c0_seq1:427-2343(-)
MEVDDDQPAAAAADGDTESSDVEWEEVPELPDLPSDYTREADGSLILNIEQPAARSHRDSEISAEEELRQRRALQREVRELQREMRIDLHRTHLLCLIANSVFCNRVAAHPVLQAVVLSQLDPNTPAPDTVADLSQLVTSFKKPLRFSTAADADVAPNPASPVCIDLDADDNDPAREMFWQENEGPRDSLLRPTPLPIGVAQNCKDLYDALEKQTVTRTQLAQALVLLLRSLGLRCRLVCALYPWAIRPRTSKPSKRSSQSDVNAPGAAIAGHRKRRRLSAPLTHWLEVYVEQRWVAVEPIHGLVDQPDEIEEHSASPFVYVFGFDNRGKATDLTARYSKAWLAGQLAPHRVEDRWVRRALRPFTAHHDQDETSHTTRIAERREKRALTAQHQSAKLPASFGAFKKHKLYALERHLGALEAIYPKEPVVGYCKGEPIYPRENVQPLLSEQRWLKEGRVVRTGEQAHKTVPARGKAADDEAPGTPVFGLWQTQEYEPPVAADGKVPRNQYGTVDLYKPSMLPIGTVFLDLPRAAREAKELGIDYAYAVTGFEYQNGQMTPIKSGIVVCSEFEDLLRDAWRQRQQLNAEKAVRNRERQVVRRWAQLVQRLLLHNRVAGVFRSTGALSYSVEEDGDCETED